MKAGLRQSMAWLHGWAGFIPGWLMFIIFLFGSTAFFRHEVSAWMRPELTGSIATPAAQDAATAYLAVAAPDAATWTILLPGPRGGDPIGLSWEPRDGSMLAAGEAALDPATGRTLEVRDTDGGDFLYSFHYNLHYVPWKWGRYIVLTVALAMLVTILSGIVTHKKVFANFFMLRFGKGQRSWLDAHNATAVLALPFHLMITYTGLVTLLFTAMPWGIEAHYPDRRAFLDARFPPFEEFALTGRPAPALPLSLLTARATTALGGSEPDFLTIRNPGDASATVELWPRSDRLAGAQRAIQLSAVNGEVLRGNVGIGPAAQTHRTMIDLHAGRFSPMMLRWLYFLSGLAGTAMIATGLILWTVKRRARLREPQIAGSGLRLSERLNIGVVTGAPAGIAVYFLANRLLPTTLAERADREIDALFAGWALLVAWALVRRRDRLWVETLAASAALYAAVPFVNALTTDRGMVPSLLSRDWLFASFDLVMIAVAALFLLAVRKARKRAPQPLTGTPPLMGEPA